MNRQRRATILVVRHGETDYKAEDRYQGASAKPHLSDFGRRQSDEIAKYLGRVHVDRVSCSPLPRAVETLEILRPSLPRDTEVAVDEGLRELDIPEWQGRLKAEIASAESDRLALWRTYPEKFESSTGDMVLHSLYERVQGVANTMCGQHGTTLVVGHEHVNRALIASLLAIPSSVHSLLPQSLSSLSVLHAEPYQKHFELRASNIEHRSGQTLPLGTRAGGRIVLVRHGVTVGNRSHIYQGSARDHGLDPDGVRQIERLGALLGGIDPRLVVSSELRRARESAALLPFASTVARDSDKRLNEFDYGHWSGIAASEVARRYPHELTAWKEVQHMHPIKGAEPIPELQQRVEQCLAEVWSTVSAGQTAVLVAHDIVIRVAISTSLDLPIHNFWKFPIENAAVSELVRRPDGRIVLMHHNLLPGRLLDRHDHEYF